MRSIIVQSRVSNNASTSTAPSNASSLNRSVPLHESVHPSQLPIKFLPASLQLMQECFTKHKHLFMHLYYIACMMKADNILRASISDIAHARKMKYGAASVAMRQLCNYQIIARTGTQFLWMINPYIVYKCSDHDLVAVQEEWKEYV